MWSTEYGDNIAASIQGRLTWRPEDNSTTLSIVNELDLLLTQDPNPNPNPNPDQPYFAF